MTTIFNLSFILKKSKILANNTAPIYVRLTIDGKRVEFASRRYIIPDKWNPTSQKMTGSNEEARSFNQYLKTLEQRVYEAHRLMIESRIPISVEGLRDKVLGRTTP